MDYLAEYTIILIAKKVVEHGTQPLFSFMQTLKNHLRICRFPVVLRSLPPEYANAIHDDEIPIPEFNFFHRMIESGHDNFYIVRALNIMYDVEPNAAEAKHVLKFASAVGSNTADYFLMMLTLLLKEAKKSNTQFPYLPTSSKPKHLKRFGIT